MGWAEGEGPASTPQEIMIANVFLSSPALGTIKWGEPALPERAGIRADIHIIPVHSPAGSHTSGLCGRRKTGLRRGLQENWFSVENNERVRGAGARALNHTASVPHERPKPHNTEIKAIRFFTPLLLPHSPPAPRHHITHSAHNKQNRPKRRGMKRTVCFCLLLRPSKRRTAALNRLADFVKATACRKCSIRPSGCGGKGRMSLLGRQCQGEDDVVWWWDQGLHMKEAGCLGAAVGTIVVNNLHAFGPSLSWLLLERTWTLSSLIHDIKSHIQVLKA